MEDSEESATGVYVENVVDVLRKSLLELEDHLVVASGYQFRYKGKKVDADSDDEVDETRSKAEDENEEEDEKDDASLAPTVTMSDRSGAQSNIGTMIEYVDQEDERTANRHQKKPRKVPWYSLKERASWQADLGKAKNPWHLAYCTSVFYLYTKPILKYYEPPPLPKKSSKADRARQLLL
eukprot:TRINITY_DN3081_c0_g1_i3.p2 TRINITY_DN3081_c0_g1~~TRINITY_DN3081_c0_g1_i3.p2  ORF type:complete len:180 (+),score=33.40 TRINITY_DN3081_c0_g1_i3:89-628(+)